MAFNLQQFKESLEEQFDRVHARIDAAEHRVHEIAAKQVETDKDAVRLKAIYESEHIPKTELERRITKLETNQVIYICIGSIIGGAIVTGILKLLGI